MDYLFRQLNLVVVLTMVFSICRVAEINLFLTLVLTGYTAWVIMFSYAKGYELGLDEMWYFVAQSFKESMEQNND